LQSINQYDGQSMKFHMKLLVIEENSEFLQKLTDQQAVTLSKCLYALHPVPVCFRISHVIAK